MSTTIIVDTGPLIASINKKDQYHKCARKQSQEVPRPYLTCEAVLSEAWFLLQRFPADQGKLLRLLEKKDIRIDFDLSAEVDGIVELLRRYENVPISVADACLVRMSERHADSLVFTTDTDFNIYRRYRNQIIPALLPPST